MRVVVQRVSRAKVTIDRLAVASIGVGLTVLVGFTSNDDVEKLGWMSRKLTGLRIFDDEAGRMNRSIADVGGSLLVVSQFTLYADIHKGKRPSFVDAAKPELALGLYEKFCEMLKGAGVPVQTGEFGARMSVDLCNDGPVTILMER